uniref:MOG interacting and ectopic P-granules protein 1 n=1 Tax=Anopheles epiroticus TaxID=199890 RepID=A0A182PMU0_9DIPT
NFFSRIKKHRRESILQQRNDSKSYNNAVNVASDEGEEMGEVGANATETTAPPPSAGDSSSTVPKENGEVNGTTDTEAKDVSASINKDSSEKDVKEEKVEDEEEEAVEAKNGTSSEANGSTSTMKDSDSGKEPTSSSTGDESQKQAAPEEKQRKSAISTVAPSGEEKLHKADDSLPESDDGEAKGNNSHLSSLEKAELQSKRSKQSKEVETMEVDEEEDCSDVVAVDAENGTANGGDVAGSDVKGGDGNEAKAVASKLDQSKAAEVDDDEPMEVDGEQEPAAAPTNGHTESNAEEDSDRRSADAALTSSKTVKENDKSKQQPASKQLMEDEEDDEKPVSINSDSDSEEMVADKPPKPASKNVILVDEGGLAKLSESVSTQEVTAVGGDVAPAKNSNSSDSASSNGVNAVAATAVATRNQNGDCDGDLTILSDKEDDCVVIEDDDGESDASMPPVAAANSARRSSSSIRGRNSDGPAVPLMAGSSINHIAVAAMQQQQQQQNNQVILPSMDDDDEEEDDDDIEEIIDDPLSLSGPTNLSMSGRGYQANAAVNLKGQKSLLMNSVSGGAAAGGKDPTLVLIDTNNMMNNGGSQRASAANLAVGAVTSPNVNSNAASLLAKASNAGILTNANISPGGQFNSRSLLNTPGIANSTTASAMMAQQGVSGGMLGKNAAVSSLTPVTPLLPALTDDMFVLEAPSFIVPYIYEKPPVDNLRDIVDELEVTIKEMRKKLEESGAVLPAEKQSGSGGEGPSTSSEQGKEQEGGKKDTMASVYGDKDSDKNKNNKKRKRNNDDDDDWDELETSTDDEASDEEQKTKVLIKEAKADIEAIKEQLISAEKDDLAGSSNDPKKSENYFENPLGKFFMSIGINLVQEFVQTDLLRQQKRKRDREGKPSPSTQLAINSLMKNLEQSKENNKPYKFEMKRCEYCPFKSESALVMAHHYETPHMRNFIYKCNFCAYETRPPHDILYHMEAVHNIKGRMEKALSYHHCPNCPFEDNGKSKLARHAVACAKKFRPELNLNPPMDWEPPAKIPRIKPKHGLVGTATAYQAMTAQQQKNIALANQQRLNQQQVVSSSVHLQQQHLTHSQLQQQQLAGVGQQHLGLAGANAAAATLNNVALANLSPAAQAVAIRARAAAGMGAGVGTGAVGGGGRAPAIIPSPTGITGGVRNTGAGAGVGGGVGAGMSASALAASAAAIRNTLAGAGMVIPNNLQLSASALAVAAAGGFSKYLPNASSMKTTKTAQAPSISITPLPRQSSSNSNNAAVNMSNIAGALSKLQAQGTSAVKPGQNPSGGKMAFVVCEICDGYIKDLDQLRNHMQWIHKVKIHPKMIYNRPPLNCQKCQYRFFTDQGLERHLLGSHGLVTSSMQEAANKGKDAGRCPVCGRVYQWKLLNHVSRDHNMTLKPAHLSYKCTVCTATFGMYKQFESHVYSAHSTVAKKTGEGKGNKGGSGGGMGQQASSGMGGGGGGSSSSGGLRNPFVGGGDSLLKPLKINDEITIIPQPTSNSSKMAKTIELESHVID